MKTIITESPRRMMLYKKHLSVARIPYHTSRETILGDTFYYFYLHAPYILRAWRIWRYVCIQLPDETDIFSRLPPTR